MDEKIIYEGRPSQLINLGRIIGGILFCWLIIPLIMLIVRLLQTRYTHHTITDHCIISERGVFSKRIDETQLKRVIDIRLEQPFMQRIFGLSTLYIASTDVTDRFLVIPGIHNGKQVWSELRDAIAAQRTQVTEQEFRRV